MCLLLCLMLYLIHLFPLLLSITQGSIYYYCPHLKWGSRQAEKSELSTCFLVGRASGPGKHSLQAGECLPLPLRRPAGEGSGPGREVLGESCFLTTSWCLVLGPCWKVVLGT